MQVRHMATDGTTRHQRSQRQARIRRRRPRRHWAWQRRRQHAQLDAAQRAGPTLTRALNHGEHRSEQEPGYRPTDRAESKTTCGRLRASSTQSPTNTSRMTRLSQVEDRGYACVGTQPRTQLHIRPIHRDSTRRGHLHRRRTSTVEIPRAEAAGCQAKSIVWSPSPRSGGA